MKSKSENELFFHTDQTDQAHLSQNGDILLKCTLQTYSCSPASFLAIRKTLSDTKTTLQQTREIRDSFIPQMGIMKKIHFEKIKFLEISCNTAMSHFFALLDAAGSQVMKNNAHQRCDSIEATKLRISQKHIFSYPFFKILGEFENLEHAMLHFFEFCDKFGIKSLTQLPCAVEGSLRARHVRDASIHLRTLKLLVDLLTLAPLSHPGIKSRGKSCRNTFPDSHCRIQT